MAKEYVPVFFDWLDVTQDLTAEEKGNLIDAVVAYASGKEYEHLLTGGCKIAFRFLKGQVDRNNAISDARSEARKNKPEETESNFPKEKDKEKEKEKEKENNKENKKEPQKRFTPPTVDEVAEYCRNRNNGIDAEYFVAYYTARNWVLSNGKKMSDWKAAVSTWEKRNKTGNNFAKPSPPKTVSAGQYTQRDYDGEQEAAMDRMLRGLNADAG